MDLTQEFLVKNSNQQQPSFARLIHTGHEISSIQDIDILLETILFEARRFTGADAGSIYIKNQNGLEIKYTQNDTLQKKSNSSEKLVYSKICIPLDSSTIAGHVGSTGEILNIKDVYNMPKENLYCFNSEYDKIAGYHTSSMLVFPLKDHRSRISGVLQLINAKKKDGTVTTFSSKHETMALHFAQNASQAIERAMLTRSMIMRMIQMAELRDPRETGSHVNRVGAYSVEIYEKWAKVRNLNEQQIRHTKDILRMAAMLHDVGKIAISDTILKKPGKLTKEEFETMKHHTWLGARLFINKISEFDEAAFDIALNHHERWDGGGYPGFIDPETGSALSQGQSGGTFPCRGKKGEEIPVLARIVSVADVYDALNSRRVYKKAWDEKEVLRIMREEAGQQFEPEIIESMLSVADVLKALAMRYPD